jgi:hypothetical protein
MRLALRCLLVYILLLLIIALVVIVRTDALPRHIGVALVVPDGTSISPFRRHGTGTMMVERR